MYLLVCSQFTLYSLGAGGGRLRNYTNSHPLFLVTPLGYCKFSIQVAPVLVPAGKDSQQKDASEGMGKHKNLGA